MTSAARPLRVGLVGAGFIAPYHVRALRHLRNVALTAVCDTDHKRAVALGRQHHVPDVYSSMEVMLAEQELDAVHLLTPPDSHHATARAALEAGAHVLLEKPICITEQECSALLKLARSQDRRIGVSHNFLFYPVYEQLRSDLRSGLLGRPDHVTITWHAGLPVLSTGPFDLWMLRDPRNIMLEIGSHVVAQLLDLLGPPDELHVMTSNPVTLPSGTRFFRRWQVLAACGPTAVELLFSFVPAFAERRVHVRGTLGTATADLGFNTYELRRHTRYADDCDRYFILRRAWRGLRRQAWLNLWRYFLSKFKLSEWGGAYAYSIARSVRAFYDGSDLLDERIGGEFGRAVIQTCVSIGAQVRTETVPAAVALRPDAVRTGTADVLVLGGTGFIGREVVRQLLATGHAVRVLSRHSDGASFGRDAAKMELCRGTVLSDDDIARAMRGIRCVFHLARPFVKSWPDYYEQEVLATRRVAEECLRQGVQRLIYTGTIASYYAGRKAGVITEETPLDPKIHHRDNYSRAKAMSEEILRTMHRQQGLPVVIVRPGIVIGTGGSPYHWGVGMWTGGGVCQMWGDGGNPLPIVLVDDVARALVAAMDVPGVEGESFNLVGEPLLSANDYLDELEHYSGVKLQRFPTPIWRFYLADVCKWIVKTLVRHPERHRPSYRDWESRTTKATFDCTKAARVLGWQPVRGKDEIITRGIHLPIDELLS